MLNIWDMIEDRPGCQLIRIGRFRLLAGERCMAYMATLWTPLEVEEVARGPRSCPKNKKRKKKRCCCKDKQGTEMSDGGAAAKKTKWPVIKPKRDLQITRLRDTHLFTVQNFFTTAESKAFVKAAESIGFVHQGSLGPAKGEAFRDNDRTSVNDPVLAETIWESGLRNFFSDIKIRGKVAVGLNPNIRFYRYKVGQRFGRHIDESVDLADGSRTYYTLLIYLSGGVRHKGNSNLGSNQDSSEESLVGGETVFYDSRRGIVAEVAPVEGMALLHIHGDKCMLHEARNVTKGIKYVFRSDVAFA